PARAAAASASGKSVPEVRNTWPPASYPSESSAAVSYRLVPPTRSTRSGSGGVAATPTRYSRSWRGSVSDATYALVRWLPSRYTSTPPTTGGQAGERGEGGHTQSARST